MSLESDEVLSEAAGVTRTAAPTVLLDSPCDGCTTEKPSLVYVCVCVCVSLVCVYVSVTSKIGTKGWHKNPSVIWHSSEQLNHRSKQNSKRSIFRPTFSSLKALGFGPKKEKETISSCKARLVLFYVLRLYTALGTFDEQQEKRKDGTAVAHAFLIL